MRRKIVLAGLLTTLLAVAAPPAQAAPEAHGSATCGALARGLIKQTKVYRGTPSGFRRFVEPWDIICHDFTGDGRRDVAFAILSGGTGGAFKFAVFRRTAQRGGSLAGRYVKIDGARTRVEDLASAQGPPPAGAQPDLPGRRRQLLPHRRPDGAHLPVHAHQVDLRRQAGDPTVSRRAAAIAALGLALALNGCGDDDEGRVSQESSGTETATVATDTNTETAPAETSPTETETAPQDAGAGLSDGHGGGHEAPEDQPGGAGDEIPASTQAQFTGRAGRITPRLVRVPPFIAVKVELRSGDGATLRAQRRGQDASRRRLRSGRAGALRRPEVRQAPGAEAAPVAGWLSRRRRSRGLSLAC